VKKILLVEAVRVSREKFSSHPQKEFIHYSFIVQGNRILGYGVNRSADPLIHWGYRCDRSDELPHRRHRRWEEYRPKIHAEIDDYRKVKSIIDHNKGFDIINIRLNRKGELRDSKPCKSCFHLLTELGCSKFWYSSEIGFLKI
jgi:deoxycytidylate deaminase